MPTTTYRSLDARQVLDQLGAGARMNLGAREYVAGEDVLMFRIGAARPYRKVIVRLNDRDLYDVEIVRLKNRGLDVVTDWSASGVYGEDLAETLIRAHGEITR